VNGNPVLIKTYISFCKLLLPALPILSTQYTFDVISLRERQTASHGHCALIHRRQKIVPSLSISIGGPPVSGRLILAISRPPFQVAPSSTCASDKSSADKLSCVLMRSAILSLVERFENVLATPMKMLLGTHSSITVMALHSTIAG